MPTIDELTGMVSDLTARLSRLENQGAQSQPSPQPVTASSGLMVPFWTVTYNKGLTLTTGAALDWDTVFDAATTWPIANIVTGAGEFDQGNLGTAFQRRWVITWDAAAASTVLCWVGGTSVYTADADANVQVKHQGKMVEYVAGSGPDGNVSQTFSLNVVKGRNRLAISADIHPDTLQFIGTLFVVGRGDKFVDPGGFPDRRTSTT